MKKATKIIIGTTAAAAAVSVGASALVFNEVMNRDAIIYRKVIEAVTKNTEPVKKDDDPRKIWFDQQTPVKYEMINPRGFRLKAIMIPADKPSKKFVFCSHGYRSNSTGEYGHMAKFYHDLGFNVFIVDHQAHGESDGKWIGFGYHESADGMLWIKWLIEKFGEDIEIVLQGISMGCATVMMMTGNHELPDNVKFTVADCGYTSCTAEFEHILNDFMHLPNFPILYTADIFNRIINGFDFNDVRPIESVGLAKIPMLFIHGDKDDFVPTYMVHQLYAACSSEDKDLLIVKGADHAASYMVDSESYENAVKKFIDKYISK